MPLIAKSLVFQQGAAVDQSLVLGRSIRILSRTETTLPVRDGPTENRALLGIAAWS
jgi:hypothetical protein